MEQQEQEQQPELLASEEELKEKEQQQQQEGEDSMGPAAKKQRVDGADGGSGGGSLPQQQQQQKKKRKAPTPEQAVRTEIHQAAKANDLAAALAAFDRAKAGGIRLSPDLYVSLLYLCGGGDSWVQQLRQQEAADAALGAGEPRLLGANDNGPAAVEVAAAAAAAPEGQQPDAAPAAAPLPQPCAEEVLRRAQGLFDEMQASQGRLHLNEMCYTAMARLAAGGGDADKAFQLAQASWAGWTADCGVVICWAWVRESWATLLTAGLAVGNPRTTLPHPCLVLPDQRSALLCCRTCWRRAFPPSCAASPLRSLPMLSRATATKHLRVSRSQQRSPTAQPLCNGLRAALPWPASVWGCLR